MYKISKSRLNQSRKMQTQKRRGRPPQFETRSECIQVYLTPGELAQLEQAWGAVITSRIARNALFQAAKSKAGSRSEAA
jgi:hypothetical protein